MSIGAGRAARLVGLGLVVSVGLWPLVPLVSRYWPASAPLEHALGVWFDLHCQRDPARTPDVFGVPLAVCARCSGIYFGLGLGALLRRPRLSPPALRFWVVVAAALMLTDVALERFGVHGAWTTARLLTGVLLAFPVGAGLGELLAPAPNKASAQSP
jgi:uncharacterized membrane protein